MRYQTPIKETQAGPFRCPLCQHLILKEEPYRYVVVDVFIPNRSAYPMTTAVCHDIIACQFRRATLT